VADTDTAARTATAGSAAATDALVAVDAVVNRVAAAGAPPPRTAHLERS
jgi:hypothetical protein